MLSCINDNIYDISYILYIYTPHHITIHDILYTIHFYHSSIPYTIYYILYASTITLYHILYTTYYSERPGRAWRNHNKGGTCSPFECVAPGSGAAGAETHAPSSY